MEVGTHEAIQDITTDPTFPYKATENVTLLGGLKYISKHPGTAIPYLTIAILACILGVVGNIAVLFAVFSYKPLRNVNNAILVNLALADLTVASLGDTFSVVGKCTYIYLPSSFGMIGCPDKYMDLRNKRFCFISVHL